MASPLASALSLHNLVGVPSRSSMELREACHSFPLGRRRGNDQYTRFCSPKRFLPLPFKLRWMQQQNDPKANFHRGIYSHLSGSALMSPTGDSVIMCKGLRKVLWSIEADVMDGYLLFITGDPISLGCWDPEMAIHLSRYKEHDNLWMTEIKVPCGIHFKYNYFIKDEKNSLKGLIWRPGPEFSLSVPSLGNENDVILVRDCWMRTKIQGPPVPSWGSWMLDIDFPHILIKHGNNQASPAGEDDIMSSLNGAPFLGEQFPVRMPKEEHELFDKDVIMNCGGSEEKLSEHEQPVEEPWLLRSTLLSFSEFGELNEAISQEDQTKKIVAKLHETDKRPSEDEHKAVRLEEPASTVILINSSVCTMQRIAVLEDDKLVELLLEPVKNNVQCDSIYLGVLTKLVPHMGGAFIDIGISRLSFMDIKRNREPFVYPPFRHETEREFSSKSNRLEKKVNIEVHEDEQPSYEDDDVTDELLEVDNLDEHEIADGLDVSDTNKMNASNDIIQLNGVEADFEEISEEHENLIEDEYADDFPPVEEESSNNSNLPLLIQQSLKDSDYVHKAKSKWSHVREGTKVLVQVVKEGLGSKGPALTAYPNLRSRFWILITRCDRIGVSKKITGGERTRLKVIAKSLKPPGFGLTVRTVAAGHSLDELKKDLDGLISTWKGIVEHAKSAALAAEEGVEGAVPVMLHRAMGQTLSVVQDYFNEKVKSMVVDSPRTFHEVTSYLQEIAPDLCNRVKLYDKRIPIFDEYNIEEEIDSILSKRVPLSNGGYLVIEQTEALVSIDVNGGQCMLGEGTSQEKAVLDVNLAAVKQIARELRLRDIGGIIVVDFIDMTDESNKRLVYEEMKKAVERDRSTVRVSELSKLGLMEITRKRVRPSVTFMISEPCTCCHATGRVEALETSFSKIEHEICRLLAASGHKPDHENAKSWPRFVLRVDRDMCNYLTSGKRTKLAVLSSSLKVWILLKVARGFPRGAFEVKPFTDDKGNDVQQVAISRLRPTEARAYISNTKLTLFPVKKWKSRGK
ncbi:ribonuclease E/G-like protein, chloroplastic isoform X1 [Canna indica]|uniref:Ribonuclease E/G-like protein, chloroplastic isoform X1 n=1 Tax=Canna indica TaxID=4628 RepID=A0AAQ3JY22_9LILI|nr:ribonuclease E/G-like protein, chloroplastic isoform X1 [Canna indica]